MAKKTLAYNKKYLPLVAVIVLLAGTIITLLVSSQIQNLQSLNTVPRASDFGGFNNPVIVTSKLETAFKSWEYEESMEATDKDNDKITMEIYGLPPGISEVGCPINQRGRIVCNIYGVTTKVGKYRVVVQVFDSKGGFTTKGFPLTVKSPPQPPPGP